MRLPTRSFITKTAAGSSPKAAFQARTCAGFLRSGQERMSITARPMKASRLTPRRARM